MKFLQPLLYSLFIFTFFIAMTVADKSHSLTMFSGDKAIVTGTITGVDSRSFGMDSGEGTFVIDVTDLDLDADLRDFLAAGAKVAVRGSIESRAFGDTVIEADEVLMVGADLSELAASQLLLYDRGDVGTID